MQHSRRPQGAFSLLEVLAVVAILGILSAVALQPTGILERASRFHKLSSDAQSLNRAIRVYAASGGSLEGLTDPQQIIDKLKTTRTAESDAKYAGFGGSMVDLRLKAVAKSEDSQGVWNKVVTWDPDRLRFVIGEGDDGVVEFTLDEALATVDYGTEARQNSLYAYNTGDGWIWTYNDESRVVPGVIPTQIPLLPAGGLPGGGSGSGGGGTPGGGEDGEDDDEDEDDTPWPNPDPSDLQAPAFSLPAGDYRPSQFDLTVALTNPNPAQSTWLLVSVNQGPFSIYTGPLTVQPDSVIVAYANGQPDLWRPSSQVSNLYAEADPTPLSAPTITPSSTQFSVPLHESIYVALSNPNPAQSSRLEYRIGASGSWSPYVSPFSLGYRNYLNGATIQARSVSLSPDYTDSLVASTMILAPRESVAVTFNLLSSRAGYLNAATLFIGGQSHSFGNSDMGAGFSFTTNVDINPYTSNRFDMTIDTWMRHGNWISGLDTRDNTGFQVIGANSSFQGASNHVAKIKDLSTQSQIHMIVGFEDLIKTGGTPDWDYDDFHFEIRASRTFDFTFGNYAPGSGVPSGGGNSGGGNQPVTVSSPNTRAISNVIFYFREPSTNLVRRVKWDSVSGEVMSMRFNFAGSAYANQTVIGYSVKAGNNNGGPNGEGEYVSVSGSRPSSWNQYIQTTYNSGVSGGVITVLQRK